jgi:HTH-type transcriptional regulator/antitoxin HigA
MIKPIKNKKQYKDYLKQAYQLMQLELKVNSDDSDKLQLLSILIEQYEKENFPIEPPHPIEAILFRLDQLNMKKSELSKILGTRSRTSEILSGKRKLSLTMIRKLNTELNIPAEVLIRDYQMSNAS